MIEVKMLYRVIISPVCRTLSRSVTVTGLCSVTAGRIAEDWLKSGPHGAEYAEFQELYLNEQRHLDTWGFNNVSHPLSE